MTHMQFFYVGITVVYIIEIMREAGVDEMLKFIAILAMVVTVVFLPRCQDDERKIDGR